MRRVHVLTSHGDGSSLHESRRWSRRVRLAGSLMLGGLGSLLVAACTPDAAPASPTVPNVAPTPTASVATATPVLTPAPALPTAEPSAQSAIVRRGAIDPTITLNGRVAARNELPVTASATMQSVRVLVSPGSTVSEGQALIESGVGDLRQQAAEARDHEQAAAVRAGQAQARIQDRLRQATEDVDRLQRSSLSADLLLAQSTASQARAGVQRAEADLAILTAPPRESDVRAAEQQIRVGEIALQRAEAERDQVLAGASEAELRKAENDVAAAEIAVRQASEGLERVESGPDSLEVQSAQRQVQLAQMGLQAAHRQPPAIASAQALVVAARGRSSRERQAVQTLARQQIQTAIAQQQLDIQRAEADLATAVRRLQQVTQGASSQQLEDATHAYEVTLRSLTDARERLATLQAGPTQPEIDAANAAADGARISLEQAQARRAAMTAGPPAEQLTAARSAVASARAALTAAEARVTDLAAQQRSQVQQLRDAQTRVTLLQGISTGAVNSLDEAARPDPDPDVVQFAQVQTELAEARQQLASLPDDPGASVIVAPVGGMVSAVLIGRGEDLEPGRPVLTMVRLSDLIVQATLENPDSPTLVQGMSARVRISTVGTADLVASVDRVDQVDGRRTVQVSVTWSSPFPAVGTEARIVVPLQRREGILLVPKGAIRVDGSRRFVVVVNGTTTARVDVSTGFANDTDVEISNGLQEGQRVLVGS